MFRKTILSATFAAILVTGCSTLTNEQTATLDREAEITRIVNKIDNVGYEQVQVSPGLDEFLNGLSSYVEQQRNVAIEYRTIADEHGEVATFLAANHGKTAEELQAAALKFDQGAKSNDDKFANKLTAYTKASEKISEENANLASALTIQGVRLGIYVTQYGTQITKILALNSIKGMFSDDEDDGVLDPAEAVIRAQEQVSLLDEINGLITADQEVAESLTKLQKNLDART
jgi:hypothetical protein